MMKLYTKFIMNETSQNHSNSSFQHYFDLTAQMTNKLVVFPGDPPFQQTPIPSAKNNTCHDKSLMQMCNHAGTHIDFPSHVISNGKASNDFELDYLMGSGVIVDVPEKQSAISKSFVESLQINQGDIVFFKTSNSKLSKVGQFHQQYVYVQPDASQQLIRKKVKIVGIDYISIDAFEKEDLPVHNSLLSNNILIVEGLCLENAPIGRCHFCILPIKIPHMDGLPARVLCYL